MHSVYMYCGCMAQTLLIIQCRPVLGFVIVIIAIFMTPGQVHEHLKSETNEMAHYLCLPWPHSIIVMNNYYSVYLYVFYHTINLHTITITLGEGL